MGFFNQNYMRKFNFFIVFALVMMMPLVAFAEMEQKGVHEPGTGLEGSESSEMDNSVDVRDTEDVEDDSVDMYENESEDAEVSDDSLDMDSDDDSIDDGSTDDDLSMDDKGEKRQLKQAIHESGTGLENPELKEEMQEKNMIRANIVDDDDDATGTQMKIKVQNKDGEGFGPSVQMSEQALQRRSQVANAVQEMLQVADRHSGVGEQIREIAQNQNQLMEQAEESLQEVKERGKFTRFLIGPNYRKLGDVETQLETHTQKLEEIKSLRDEMTSTTDKDILDKQILLMENVSKELKDEVDSEEKGFSLFGWLNRLFVK